MVVEGGRRSGRVVKGLFACGGGGGWEVEEGPPRESRKFWTRADASFEGGGGLDEKDGVC